MVLHAMRKEREQQQCDLDHTKNVFNELDMCTQTYDCASKIASIHNLVGTSRVSSPLATLNLRMISSILPNAHYERQKFAAITIRLANPLCTVLLFTSGKMVLTGCKTYLDCLFASLSIVNMLRVHFTGLTFGLETIKVQNIVGNADLRLQKDEFLDLVAFYEEHNVWSTYQPNMFPGLIYRPTDIPIVLLLFYSGKIVITGAKTMQGVHDGWAQLHDLVKSFVRVKSSNRER